MSDYLWDKTGHDPEVEALEAALLGLAYDGEPPALPAPLRRAPAPEAGLPPLAARAPARGRVLPWRGARVAPLFAALLLMLAGFGLATSALQRERAEARKGWNLVPVVVAAVDLTEGTVVTSEHLSQRSIPEQFVTASVVKPDTANLVLGQKVLVPVAAGDAMRWSQFETARVAERLAQKVLQRARALTVGVSAVSAVGGWVRPNDAVDVIGSFKDPATNEQVAVTLLQNVLVLATGKVTGTTNVNLLPESERSYRDLSLMVLPEEAELLVLAQELGNLTFTLRHPDDLDVLEERGRATLHTLLSGERTKVLQQRRFNTIQVIRGTQPPAPTK